MNKIILSIMLMIGVIYGQSTDWIPFRQTTQVEYCPIRTNVGGDSLNIKVGFSKGYSVKFKITPDMVPYLYIIIIV